MTTFYIRLPQASQQPNLTAVDGQAMDLFIGHEELSNHTDLEIHGTSKPRILIVETAAYNMFKITTMLSGNTYAYHTVYSGQSCLEKLQEIDVDLLIVNHLLEDMSGYHLIETIRETYTYNDLPILLVISNANTEEALAGFKYGANDYVTKPIFAEEFNARVRTLLTIKQSVDKQLRLEASWLQAQIKPHFIFNVINSIIALSEVDVTKMRFMLGALSELLQYKFEFYNTSRQTTIKEEVDITKNYLEIEKIRFGDRLEIEMDVDQAALSVNLPFLTIEPLVENAIEHGLMQTVLGGKVKIDIKNYDQYIHVLVEDNGVGMSEAKVKAILSEDERQEGIGIINTHLRLKKAYGSGLSVDSELNIGTKVSFIIPK